MSTAGQSVSTATDFTLTDPMVCIVDDEPINIKVVRKYLQVAGYNRFLTTSDSTTAMAMIEADRPDVLLLDVMMPEVNGIQILTAIRAHRTLRHMPVIILTASTDAQTKSQALNAGATDFLAKPVDPSDLLPRLRNTLIVKAHNDHLERYNDELSRQVRLRTIELELSRLQVVHCLARAAEFRDDTTGRHVIRVGRYAAILGRELGMSDTEAGTLGLAAQLHDVGKIGLPDSILLKPAKLTDEEYTKVKTHCDIGVRIVEPLSDDEWRTLRNCSDTDFGIELPERDPLLLRIGNIAHCHHERYDGKGYPRGLAGEAIPLEARIVSVADVFDALSTKRPYKPSLPLETCLSMMDENRGTQFDPNVLDAMHRRIDDFLKVRTEQADCVSQAA